MFKSAAVLAPYRAGEQDPDADEVDECLGAACQTLVVLAETTLSANLREGALDHGSGAAVRESRKLATRWWEPERHADRTYYRVETADHQIVALSRAAAQVGR